MTTTIHADGPLYVGPPYATASFNEFVTVLHVLVVGVFVLSLVAACAAMAVAVLSVHPGCGPVPGVGDRVARDGCVLRDGCLDRCVGGGGHGQGPAHPARRDGACGRRGVVHHVAGAVVVGRLLRRVR